MDEYILWTMPSDKGIIDIHLDDADCVALATLTQASAQVYDQLTNQTFTIHRDNHSGLVASSSAPFSGRVLTAV